MPYSSNSDLPEAVRNALPEAAQSVFRSVVDEALGDGDSEESAFQQAWGAVRQNWKKGEDGKWIKKSDPADDPEKYDMYEKFHIFKADADNRIIYGWASVISKNGEAVIDTQGDIIEAPVLVKAVTDFMMDAREAHVMHEGQNHGVVVHSFPLVGDIAKSLGIQCDREGWIVGLKVSPEIMKRVDSGELQAFSIGGAAVREKV